jgi:aminoglycoside phosphotransferase (APT) family kinase protein
LKPPNREALKMLLEALAPGGRVVRVRPLRGGVSSAVHLVRLESADGARRDVVVRRLNEYWQRTDPEHAAHEFRLLEHLASTHLPVATPLWLDADGSIFGEPTIVMTRLPGKALMTPRDVEDFMRKMATTLANLHRLPTDELTFLIRQRDRVDRILGTKREAEEPLQRAVWDALQAAWPRVRQTPGSSLVHSDYWPGNLLWRRDVLVGLVDWESPRLGDPTEDLATLRREMWLLFGPPAADRLTRYYEEAGGQVRNLRFWDLWVSPEALEEMPEWLPGYHALGRTDISLEYAVTSMRTFAHSALEANPD